MKKSIIIFIFIVFGSISFSNNELENLYLSYIEADNTNDNAMLLLGCLYEDQGKYQLAEKYYLMAIEYYNDTDAMGDLGALYHELGVYTLAEEYYLKAIEIGLKSDYIYDNFMLNLGILYYNQGKYDLAKKYFLMAIEYGSEDAKKALEEYFQQDDINRIPVYS